MKLEHLSIVNYKNIREADVSFSDGINCLVGNNGMGKTNLLDAIYYLSMCKPSNALPDSQVITHGEDYFMLDGHYELGGNAEEIRCGYRLKGRKSFKRNGKEYQRLSSHIGLLPLVMLTPADASLIQGGSDERRRMMDLCISQFDGAYLDALIRYNNALQQRNVLLKQDPPCTDAGLYRVWEEQLDFYGQRLYEARSRFIEQFEPVFREFYGQIAPGKEQVSLQYVSHFSHGPLLPQLDEVRARDGILGYTTRGAHKDDLIMLLGDNPMKQVGSQGQNKTFLVGLKLAQFDYLRQQGQTCPILLLDDIFDRLDSERVEQIIKLVTSDRFGQIFITDTNRENLDRIVEKVSAGYKLFTVSNGIYAEKK